MFNLTLDSIIFWGATVSLILMIITVLLEAYNVLYVENCVKHRTKSLVLFWCGVLAAISWSLIIFSTLSDSDTMKVSSLYLLGVFMLLWPISNRHNLLPKNETLDKNGN